MSTDLYVVGYRPADEQWDTMKAAWEACEAAGNDYYAGYEIHLDKLPENVKIIRAYIG